MQNEKYGLGEKSNQTFFVHYLGGLIYFSYCSFLIEFMLPLYTFFSFPKSRIFLVKIQTTNKE